MRLTNIFQSKIIILALFIILILILHGCALSEPNETSSSTSDCHPSYSECLKADASDYDCAGGSGNGPFYTGRVKVTGPDEFDLDRDNDGWGCE
ncbi:MAG: hypothetical protein WCT08_00655 [Patescibacteria group bacterium]|jgi:hypothetical protein